jgi:hypothetical protein
MAKLGLDCLHDLIDGTVNLLRKELIGISAKSYNDLVLGDWIRLEVPAEVVRVKHCELVYDLVT